METAIYLKDLNLYEIELSCFKHYKIKDKIISNPQDKLMLSKEELDDIRIITNNTIISHYIYNGKQEISIEKYNEKKEILKKEGGYDEGGEYSCSTWQDIDKEYEYKKFINNCQPINKNIQTLSKPISINIEYEIISDTGNEYIKAKYLLNGEESSLYFYNKVGAISNIINTTFKELGYNFKNKADYNETKNVKLYGYNTERGIEYMVAWGTYITPEKYKRIFNPTDTLEKVTKWYEEDIKFWKEYIVRRDKEYFSIVDLSKYNLKDIFKTINSIENDLAEYKFKKSYYSDYSILVNRVKNLKNKFNTILETQKIN